MRKNTLLLVMVFLLCNTGSVFAQEKTITGRILSDEGKAVEFATVKLKGTSKIVQTDDRGMFSIIAKKGDQLQITCVGFNEETVRIGDNNNLNLKMSANTTELETVTVAMDLKRNPRELGFSASKVEGKAIQETQRENFLNSLQGRVSGLTINQTSGTAGASSQIVLRGFNSLSLSNQPLFIVDGVIMDNQTVDETSDGGRGIGLASDRPNRNNDYTNRIADLNPNDIENITVLKGPEATALYGSQASSGAIVITTRKAKTTKLAIQYDNSFRFQQITRFNRIFDAYSNGTNGTASNIFRYFGPAYNNNSKIYNDNLYNFFKTGNAKTHNLGMDFGFKKSFFRFSASIFDQVGVVPNNNYKRFNLRLSNTTKIGKYVEVVPSIAYIKTENDKVLRSGGGYLLSLYTWPSSNNVLLSDSAGEKIPLFGANANAEYDNPIFNVNANRSRDETDRYTASLGINIDPFKWLSVKGRFGYDTYNAEGYTLFHPKTFYISQALNGTLDNYYRKYTGYNHTITATARKKLGNFTGRAMVGTMWQDYETKMFAITGNNLTKPTSTDSNNTAPNTRVRLLRNYFGEYNKQVLRQIAYFGEIALSYKNLLFVNYTHRFETASTLPSKNRNYNYPGASVSAIISDIFPAIKGKVINYAKLRASAASTARLNTPYSTQSVFVNNFASGNGFSYGFTNANPDLQPERQSTYEIGTEWRMFKNRFTLDAAYYNTQNKGQIIENFRLSYGTGFVLNTQNAASTRNQGIELSMGMDVIRKQDLRWTVNLNFNRMWNKVTGMPANVQEYYISDTWLYGNARGGLVKGGATTSITGYGYARNNNGDILINPTSGLPVVEQLFKIRGDRNPDFTLGINNSLRYKNLSLSMLWDVKMGGDVFNGTEMYLTSIGRSRTTVDRETPRVIKGVLNDGKQNTATPTINTISVIPYYNDAYYTSNNLPEEAFIEKDVNWLRLRDITLSYTFAGENLRLIKGIKSLGVFVTGNDLFLITNYRGADPASNGNTAGSRGVGAFGFDYSNLPTPISLNFGLRASF